MHPFTGLKNSRHYRMGYNNNLTRVQGEKRRRYSNAVSTGDIHIANH